MRYRVRHQTRYRYAEAVSLCHNEAYLLPRACARQRCTRSVLTIEPAPAVTREREDFFGNRVCYFAVQRSHEHLQVTADSEVEVLSPEAGLLDSPPWEAVRERVAADTTTPGLEARDFVLPSAFVPPDDAVWDYARASFPPGRPLLEAVRDLTRRIHQEFRYDPGFTTIVTPLAEVLAHRRGVCQDFAHLQIACLRSLGLPARYVSGYLETLPPPGKAKLQGADASHAWVSVYDPEQGWTDFDPTNDQLVGEQHITTAWGRDYGDVTPLKGIIFGGGEHTLEVAVDVERLEAHG